jgi:hypothetical protein
LVDLEFVLKVNSAGRRLRPSKLIPSPFLDLEKVKTNFYLKYSLDVLSQISIVNVFFSFSNHEVLRVGSNDVLSTVLDIENSAHDASYQTTVTLYFPVELSYIGPTTSKVQ